MNQWINRSKDTLKEIIDNVRKENAELDVRVCFVGYRDFEHGQRFALFDFSKDLEKVKKFISGIHTTGGNDFPEDV